MTRPRFIGLLLALITLLLYFPARHYEFITYDDDEYVSANRIVQNGVTLDGVKWAFTTWHVSNWHPLAWLSHMLDCQWFGLDAGAHHLVNVFLHTANAVLLLVLLLWLTQALWPATVVAALFAWHPLHVESVAWVAERKDVLSAFFALLTLLAYTRYARSEARGRRSKRFYVVALFLFALGLLAKPMLVTLPFVLLLLDWWPLERTAISKPDGLPLSRAVLEKLPFLALSAASCLMTLLAQRATAVLSQEQYPLRSRIGNALVSGGQYLLKTIWPANLALPYPLTASQPAAHVIVAALALALISWWVWRSRRTGPCLLMGWLWFSGMLVPVIGLVQVGGKAMADRYTYLPHIGIFIAAIYGIQSLAVRRRVNTFGLAAGAVLMLAGCLVGTERQLRFWRDSETLFTHTLAVTQNNVVAHIDFGVALQAKGRNEEALAHYREALRIDPNYAESHNNLAILLDELNRNDEARTEYEEALRLTPNAPLAHCNYGSLLLKLGRVDEAIGRFTEAARLAPEDPRPRYLMGKAELRRGQSAAAAARFREALQRDRNDVRAMTCLARLLASDDHAEVRNGAEAVALAERANTLTGGSDPFVLDTLAMAYAEAGRFEEAQRILQPVLDLARATAEEPPASLQQRQQLYQARLPFREAATNQP